MRTNVVLDEALVEQAKALTGLRTTRAVIDEALRVLIQLRRQDEVAELFGQLHWEGDLDAMREARVFYDLSSGDRVPNDGAPEEPSPGDGAPEGPSPAEPAD